MDTIYVIDISNWYHRAWFAVPAKLSSKGFPTNVITGTLNILIKFIRTYEPKYVCVACDSPNENSYRRTIYPDYKGTRDKQTDDLHVQEQFMKILLPKMGFKLISHPNFEADDVIATIANKFKDKNKVVIVTADKDMMQLVNGNVSLLNSSKEEYTREKDVESKFGVRADQISDFLALAGDKADNIPGVAGVGPVTIGALFKQFNNLDELLQKLDTIYPKTKEKIEANMENLLLSRKLVKLYDLDLDIEKKDLKFELNVNDEVISILEKVEIKELIPRLMNLC